MLTSTQPVEMYLYIVVNDVQATLEHIWEWVINEIMIMV